MTKEERLNRIDEVAHFIKNMMDEPDEIVAFNIPSLRADMKALCEDIRKYRSEDK